MAQRCSRLLFGVLALLVLVGTGCPPRTPSDVTPIRPPAQKTTLKVGGNEWVGFAPFMLAQDKGFYEKVNVEFEFIALEGDKRAGLFAKRLDVICETMDMFQTERDTADYPGVIAFGLDESLGGDGVLAVTEVQSIRDLKGRKVVSEAGLPAHFVLQVLLHEQGMTLEDIDLQLMDSANAGAAFIAGKAEIAGTYEPYLSQALKKVEGAHILASTADLPGLIVDCAIVLEETLAKRRELIEDLYNGWCKAIEFFKTNEHEAVTIMARHFKLSPEEFNDMISGLRYFDHARNKVFFGTPDNPGKARDVFKQVGEVLTANGLTKAVAPAETKVNLSIAAPE